MNVAAPQEPLLLWIYRAYVAAFFIYLAAPLAAASVFAFNDSLFPSLPWRGFTLDWFLNDTEPKLGMFHDRRIMQSLANSVYIGVIVSCLAVAVGTSNAFLFERKQFPGKAALYILMIVPLVALEMAAPFAAERRTRTPWHAHHIAERYGLLAIIALGECLIGAIETLRAIVANHGWSVDAALVGFGGTALAFAMWWI